MARGIWADLRRAIPWLQAKGALALFLYFLSALVIASKLRSRRVIAVRSRDGSVTSMGFVRRRTLFPLRSLREPTNLSTVQSAHAGVEASQSHSGDQPQGSL